MAPIHAALLQIVNRVEGFAKAKQANTIKEHLINTQLFEELRREEKATLILHKQHNDMMR